MSDEADELRQQIVARAGTFEIEQLRKLNDYASMLEIAARVTTGQPRAKSVIAPATSTMKKDWPHAPTHRLITPGTYIVTASTLRKRPIFRGKAHLDLLQDTLLTLAKQHGWNLEAWAVFPNHYHFVANAAESASKLDVLLTQLHADTAREINQRDHDQGRQVWFNFWETALTYEKSYLARLAYVHRNAVKHGLVPVANQYPWCSAGWFERTARPAQVKTIYGFKTDKVTVFDEFDVVMEDAR